MGDAERRPRILGVGIACLDYLFVSARATSGGYAPLRDHLVAGGGLVGTAVAAAARLGAEAAIWCWVGDDAEGREVVAGLRAEGVDVSGVEVIPDARTPVSFVHVEEGTGERTIYHGPRLEVSRESARAIAERPLAAQVMVVDAVWPEVSKSAARRAREAGMPVVGDFCPVGPGAELARWATHLIVPRACADRVAAGVPREEQLRALAALGPEFVAITAGQEGCWYRAAGMPGSGGPRHTRPTVGHQRAFPVEVVDTTGAGDVFHGAFAYALARRWEVGKCVKFASAAAGLCCRELGGRGGIPARVVVAELVRRGGRGRARRGR